MAAEGMNYGRHVGVDRNDSVDSDIGHEAELGGPEARKPPSTHGAHADAADHGSKASKTSGAGRHADHAGLTGQEGDAKRHDGASISDTPSDTPSALSTQRVRDYGAVPSAWLDRLLSTFCQLRADAAIEDSITQLLATARDLVDGVAVAVSIPKTSLPSGSSNLSSVSPSGYPVSVTSDPSDLSGRVVVRVSPMRSFPPFASDTPRLFPELAHQRDFSFLRDGSATLHAATNDEHTLADGTAPTLLFERLATMFGAIIENQTAAERSLRELRAQIIQTEKLASLGQIAAGIVHELNNPLTTIVAYSDFLRRKLATRADPADAADVERLARINEAAERILRFSRDLTAYSRPANESPAPVSIHDVIERALIFCEHEIEKTGVSVERDFSEVKAVRGVTGQLTQVFVNLFTNAAHAMRESGGLLSIATSLREDEDGGAVIITVSDDGHGIEEQHRARVFDPFFTTKTDGTGTGLGLSIVRNIILSHGGRISVDGRLPRGTVFHVELPIAALG